MPKVKKYTRLLQVMLEPEQYDKLEIYADRTDSDISKVVRSMIKDKLSKRPNYGK